MGVSRGNPTPRGSLVARSFDYLVFIGRFQPFHRGHESVARYALEHADRLIVLLGSSGQPRTPKNPFTAAERRTLIAETLADAGDRVRIGTLVDHPYHENRWLAQVQEAVAGFVRQDGGDGATVRIGMIGRAEDGACGYLRAFPQWHPVHAEHVDLPSATEMRERFFAGDAAGKGDLKSCLPASVYAALEAFRCTPAFAHIVAERAFLSDYRARWAGAPFPPVFLTVDAVVVCSGHVLLTERSCDPGRGLVALPGTFVRQDETLEACVLRELKEETRLRLPRPVLQGALRATRVFDHPDRSLRGRTVTQAFFFNIPEGPLPELRGATARAKWYSVGEALGMRERFFEDHFDILSHFVHSR